MFFHHYAGGLNSLHGCFGFFYGAVPCDHSTCLDKFQTSCQLCMVQVQSCTAEFFQILHLLGTMIMLTEMRVFFFLLLDLVEVPAIK